MYPWAPSFSISLFYMVPSFSLGHRRHRREASQKGLPRWLMVKRPCSLRRLDSLGCDAANAKWPLPIMSTLLSPVLLLASNWLDSIFCLRYKLISSSPSEACWAFMHWGTGCMAEAMVRAHCYLFLLRLLPVHSSYCISWLWECISRLMLWRLYRVFFPLGTLVYKSCYLYLCAPNYPRETVLVTGK